VKTLKHLAVATLILFGMTSVASAQTANQVVTIVIGNINVISVSSGSLTLTINSATAGSAPTDAVNSATSYAVTTNGSALKVTAALGTAYASGISLALNLGAPTAATSAGSTVLTTTAQDLVTGISGLAESSLGITYTASATLAAAPNGAGEAQTVTLTITT
jgi:hypothetical protein